MALFAVLFGTVYAVARFFWPGFVPTGFGWREVGGMIAVISFFFRLRVFDEMKDYELDLQNHPHRVLQSGRITLRKLFSLALAGGLLELAWSALMGGATLLCWMGAVGYSVLMRFEFFASRYLKARLLLYATTHMLVMPLVIVWIWAAYAPVLPLGKPLLLLATLSLLGGFSFEIARKIHAPAAEREGVDSYSKSVGYGPAAMLVLLILGGSVAVQVSLLQELQAGWFAAILIATLYFSTVALYTYAFFKPTEKTLRLAELTVSLSMLVSYLSIILVVFCA
jgi:4-hydroxybenzoate polyprenyltransferase